MKRLIINTMEIVVTVDSYVFHAYQNYYCKDFLYLWAEEKYTLELFWMPTAWEIVYINSTK